LLHIGLHTLFVGWLAPPKRKVALAGSALLYQKSQDLKGTSTNAPYQKGQKFKQQCAIVN